MARCRIGSREVWNLAAARLQVPSPARANNRTDRTRWTALACGNLARVILRYADRGGWRLANLERC